MKYYSPTTKGFYDEEIHGSRTIHIVDPDYVPEEGMDPPLTEVPNPNCKIPEDSISVTDSEYHSYLIGLNEGGSIEAGKDGKLKLKPVPPPSNESLVLSTIMQLESEITPRRLRDAVLNPDDTWLKDQEAKIAKERKKLK